MNNDVLNEQSRSNEKGRQMGVELLRIGAMLMIVAHHFAYHGVFNFEYLTAGSVFVDVLKLGGKLGTNIFVLITGYYSVSSSFSYKKIVRMLLQVTFYSVLTYFLAVLFSVREFSLELLIESLLPLVFYRSAYWFFTLYIVLYCLTPILNAAVNNIGKKQLGAIICLLLGIWCILPNTVGLFTDTAEYDYSRLGFFLLLYLIGGYFRLYSFPLYQKKKLCRAFLVLSCLAFAFCRIMCSEVMMKAENPQLIRWLKMLCDYQQNSIFPVIVAVLMLIFFQTIQLKPYRAFFAVSKATFGVYLLHDSPWISKYLWTSICRTDLISECRARNCIILSVVCIAAVYVACTCVELLRFYFLEKPLFKLICKEE